MRGLLCGCFRPGSSHQDEATDNGPTPQSGRSDGVNPNRASRQETATSRPTPTPPPQPTGTDSQLQLSQSHQPAVAPSNQAVTGTSLWQQAFDKLSKEEKESFVTISNDLNQLPNPTQTDTIDNNDRGLTSIFTVEHDGSSTALTMNGVEQADGIINFIRRVRATSDSRNRREFTFLDETYSLTDIYSRTISWINKFKDIGDIAIQVDPAHAALPWAATRLVLHFLVASEDSIGYAMVVVEKTSRIVHRCSVYERIYAQEDNSIKGTKSGKLVEDLLLQLYSLVLKTLLRTCQFLRKKARGRLLEAVMRPEGQSSLLSDLRNLEDEVDRAVSAFRMQCDHFRSRDVTHKLERLLSLEETILSIDADINRLLRQTDQSRLSEILKWTSAVQYNGNHQLVCESRVKETCEWVIKSPQFQEWETEAASITLWLHGPAGWGKTFLVSKIIDSISISVRNERDNEGFAFFYCNHTDSERRDAISVLRSFVRQLAAPRAHSVSNSIHPEIESFYDQSKVNGSSWTQGTCEKYLLTLLDFYPRTTLILDALDECLDRTVLLNALEDVATRSKRPIKILISSRPEGDIRQFLSHLTNIEITEAKNDKDITAFIHSTIDTRYPWTYALSQSPVLKDDVVTTVVNKSRGMFQWAKLQIEQLRELDHEHAIRERLGVLPEGLTAAYDEILVRIQGRDKKARDTVTRALSWISCSFRPLTTDELLGACCIDTEREEIDLSFEATEQLLLGWCASLLVLDSTSETPVWRPSHFSVIEYLERRHDMPASHMRSLVAKGCLVVLVKQPVVTQYHNPEVDPQSIDPNFEGNEYCFLNSRLFYSIWQYVTEHWPRHVQSQESPDCDSQVVRLLKEFLGSPLTPSATYQHWHQLRVNSEHRQHKGTFVTLELVPLSMRIELDHWHEWATPLVAMCHLSLFHLLKEWWDPAHPSFQLSDIHSSGRNLLCIAAASGCLDIVTCLIRRGAPVNPEYRKHFDRLWGDPLSAAAVRGNHEIARFLLGKGADPHLTPAIHSVDGLGEAEYSGALSAAAGRGHLETVRLILDAGADVNLLLQAGDYGSALVAAAYRGHPETCRLLLDYGADANLLLQTGNYRSALVAAAYWGSLEICRLLLDYRADINLLLQAGDYGSALAVAASKNKLEVCRLLLDRGANMNLLLQAGDYGSALTAAISNSTLEVCRLLLDRGADVNLLLQAGFFGSALIAAIFKGNLERCRLLLDYGADVNLLLQVEFFGSALTAAAYWGSLEVCRLLLDHGADVNLLLQVGSYGSALTAAAYWGRLEVCRLLLDRGADVNLLLQAGFYGSALTAVAACFNSNGEARREVAKLLLAAGADVNVALSVGDYGSALVAAIENMEYLARKEGMEFLKLLLDHGADVHLRLQCGRWYSAVEAAAAQGDEILAILLGASPLPNEVLLSGSGARLYWTVFGSLASSITVMGEDLDPDGQRDPYHLQQASETATTVWHPISQEPATEPPVPYLVVRADSIDGGSNFWEKFFPGDESQPPRPEAFVVILPSTTPFVTVHDFVSAVHPWLMEIWKLLPHAWYTYYDKLRPDTRLVVSATDPRQIRVEEEAKWLENRRRKLQADRSPKALDEA